MYPIINLRNHKMDLHWYLKALEEVVIRVLQSTFSIKASRLEGLTGVWVGKYMLSLVILGICNRKTGEFPHSPGAIEGLCIYVLQQEDNIKNGCLSFLNHYRL